VRGLVRRLETEKSGTMAEEGLWDQSSRGRCRRPPFNGFGGNFLGKSSETSQRQRGLNSQLLLSKILGRTEKNIGRRRYAAGKETSRKIGAQDHWVDPSFACIRV